MNKTTHVSITLSKAAMQAVTNSMAATGTSRSKTIDSLILEGIAKQGTTRAIEDAVNGCLADLQKALAAEIKEASAPMIKAAKSLNSARKSSSQTRQAVLASFTLLSILTPMIIEIDTFADGEGITAYNFNNEHISESEIFDWFWSLGGMLSDGRRGKINSTTAKTVAASTGRNILGSNRYSPFTLFSETTATEVEPPTQDDDLYYSEGYEEGYVDDYE